MVKFQIPIDQLTNVKPGNRNIIFQLSPNRSSTTSTTHQKPPGDVYVSQYSFQNILSRPSNESTIQLLRDIVDPFSPRHLGSTMETSLGRRSSVHDARLSASRLQEALTSWAPINRPVQGTRHTCTAHQRKHTLPCANTERTAAAD